MAASSRTSSGFDMLSDSEVSNKDGIRAKSERNSASCGRLSQDLREARVSHGGFCGRTRASMAGGMVSRTSG